MIQLKLYLYDSNAILFKGTDYSNNILQGGELDGDITQIMDTAEITLVGLDKKESFTPETKFIIDIVEDGEIKNTLHMVVARDIVSQPIMSDDSYFDHHISFIEPSVIAQKRLVDNIAVTYKLKDVTLETTEPYPTDKIKSNLASGVFSPSDNFGETRKYKRGGSISIQYTETIKCSYGKFFLTSDSLYLEVSDDGTKWEYLNTVYTPISAVKNKQVRLNIPRFVIYGSSEDSTSFRRLGNEAYASLDVNVVEYELNGEQTNKSKTFAIISNSKLDGYQTRNGEWILEKAEEGAYTLNQYGCDFYFKKYTDTTATKPIWEVDLSGFFTENHRYEIIISLHNFTDGLPSGFSGATVTTYETELGGKQPIFIPYHSYVYNGAFPAQYTEFTVTTVKYNTIDLPTRTVDCKNNFLSSNQAAINSEIYIHANNTRQTIEYASSVPYSALDLLQKAIINSGIYEKEEGFYVGDINIGNYPFVIDYAYTDRLASAKIIENFYNQKNLWEIMVDCGNYIHAIPELRFYRDDKFLITFNDLGRTDEKVGIGTRVSIYNSRSVEDYICATSSYVANMVQLGGEIDEWVAPKTTDESFTISNDTAQIVLSKPIIELLEISVKCINADSGIEVGKTADMTKYVFEENVYKTLNIDYKAEPDRGLALYYKLGDNVIRGGDYRLPQANANIYSDYAIKKVIYSAFNGYTVLASPPTSGRWRELKVNNFVFFVRYRTKDSVRLNHFRPDLRKYLLGSSFDRYPEHNQFNNQQDIVVDSEKFGHNIYGKLIRTGNNSYEETEWHDNFLEVKKKGELYRINNELYYVAKTKDLYFGSYILSTVTYSKDYNELSNVIGIPSEPRFYEISEQSQIRREVAINDILLLSDSPINIYSDYIDNRPSKSFITDFQFIIDAVQGEKSTQKYAITTFKGDYEATLYGNSAGDNSFWRTVISPTHEYTSGATLTYEWDMIDNYSAGDKVVAADTPSSATNDSYKAMQAVKYTDIYGKSALMDFYLISDLAAPAAEEIQAFPESPIIPSENGELNNTDITVLASNVRGDRSEITNRNEYGIALLKDCREAISINYNIQLVSDSDTFVISPFVFEHNKRNLRIVPLNEEVNKVTNGYIPMYAVSGEPRQAYIGVSEVEGEKNPSSIYIGIPSFTDKPKAIALVEWKATASYLRFIIARNIPNSLELGDIEKHWYIGIPDNDYFKK